jgi:magnesium chelatase family protein
MLGAAMNPCPCGYFNVPGRRCTCAERRVHDYHARVSGPLLDRIDITLQTRPVEHRLITAPSVEARPSAYYQARVEEARGRQRHRFAGEPGIHCNALMPPPLLRKHCQLGSRARRLLELAVRHHGLSARAHDRILKLARTRADLEGHAQIEDADLQLAIDCRMLDRRGWLGAEPPGRQPGYFDSLLDPPP